MNFFKKLFGVGAKKLPEESPPTDLPVSKAEIGMEEKKATIHGDNIDKNIIGKEGIYKNAGYFNKVKVVDFTETGSEMHLTLMCIDKKQAKELPGDDLEYSEIKNPDPSITLGGGKEYITFSKNIFYVLWGGKLNFNEFAINHFDNKVISNDLLWDNYSDD